MFASDIPDKLLISRSHKERLHFRVPVVAPMMLQVWSLALLGGLRIGIAMSCGVGRRRSLDPTLLWLWHRLAATALMRPLAWEPPYATGAALEKTHTHTQRNHTINIKNNLIKKWAHDMNKHFSQEDIQGANRHMKRCSTSLNIRAKCKSKPQWYHLMLVRMAIIKKNK